jgi:hypothetical protein
MGEVLPVVIGTLTVSGLGMALLIGTWAKSGERSKRDWIVMIGVLVLVEAIVIAAGLFLVE